MYENQENQEPKPELTIDEKLAEAGLTAIANTDVKPLADVLGLDVKFYGYIDNSWKSASDPTGITIRHELEKLHQIINEKETALSRKYDEVREHERKRDKLEAYLDDNWDDIDEEVRDELCSIFGIDGEVTKTIKIVVEGTIDITAPRGYDWDNIENDLNPCVDVEITNSDLENNGYGFSHDDTTIEEY